METGVGQIIATAPVSKVLYFWGKFISNFLLLVFGVAVIAISAMAMQFVWGESYTLELWPLLAPFIFLTLPVMQGQADVGPGSMWGLYGRDPGISQGQRIQAPSP